MKKVILALVVSMVAGGYAGAAIEELSPLQVRQEIESGQALVFDVNPESIYKQHHVPKAQNASFSSLSGLLPEDKSKRLIFYCMSGMCSSSHQAAEMAVRNGYRNVARMPSGIKGWLQAGFRTDTK